ncbi:CDP-diacylglycerol--serine O-phosphatidyltransferase [Halalkalibacter urbisdiaboli]|uniref:CDP-diacylglycerol--serine O-phosphatidyltransferase n=1 Tax=Halalkalibacter urbisdiaboli TaxID=1960589 RepID=UPI000B4378E9|nr:CDP-diacylglycerol--serine O-phosphatidyltransferase [Halalkalibacter urbisdiaboli]
MFLLHQLDHTVKKMKGQIANALTIINLALGTFAIIFIIQNELRMGLFFITIAAVCDRLDGAAARRLNISSEFGKQLDSLSDLVSFGVAPALIIYQAVLFEFGFIGAFFAILFISCSAIRLARFNVIESDGYFIGLPITAAGCILTLNILMVEYVPNYIFMFVTMLLSILMISLFRIKKM